MLKELPASFFFLGDTCCWASSCFLCGRVLAVSFTLVFKVPKRNEAKNYTLRDEREKKDTGPAAAAGAIYLSLSPRMEVDVSLGISYPGDELGTMVRINVAPSDEGLSPSHRRQVLFFWPAKCKQISHFFFSYSIVLEFFFLRGKSSIIYYVNPDREMAEHLDL